MSSRTLTLDVHVSETVDGRWLALDMSSTAHAYAPTPRDAVLLLVDVLLPEATDAATTEAT